MAQASAFRPEYGSGSVLMAAGDKGQLARQRIIEMANRLFYEQGFVRTSFSDIALAADMPRGNFYYHFRSKDEILQAVIDKRLADIAAMLAQWDKAIPVPLDRLKQFVRMVLNEAPDVKRFGCPMGSLNQELIKLDHGRQVEAKKLFDMFDVWLREQFELCGKPPADAARLAMHLQGRMQGIALLGAAYNDAGYIEREVQVLLRWLED